MESSVLMSTVPFESTDQAMPETCRSWTDAEGFIFDAVGTLIRPVPSVAEAYASAASRQGAHISVDEARARFQVYFASDAIHADRGHLSTDEQTERRRWRTIVEGVLPDVADPARAFEELWEHFGNPGSWRCFSDVGPALRGLEAMGVRVCVGSNFDARLRGVIAGLPELKHFGDDLVISSEVGFKKPHRSFFEKACAHLGLEPRQVVCVGDDLENDVTGAVQAGLSAVLVSRSGPGHEAHPWVSSLAALVQGRYCRA